MSSSAQGFANLSGVAVEPTVEIRPSPRRRIVKIAFRLLNELSGRPAHIGLGCAVRAENGTRPETSVDDEGGSR
jgi:hypothetical protein